MVLSGFLAITCKTSDASYQVPFSFPGFIALCQDILVDVVFWFWVWLGEVFWYLLRDEN